MHAERRQTGEDSRLPRLLRRALLVLGGTIAAAVVMSAPAWADTVDDGVVTTTTVIGSVTDTTAADELPSRVLSVEPRLVPVPEVPISLDHGLALLHELATGLPVALPSVELQRRDATASATSGSDQMNSTHQELSTSGAPDVRFRGEPSLVSSAAPDVMSSQSTPMPPTSNATDGPGNDSSHVVPRRGELSGTHLVTRTAAAGRCACRTWAPVVHVMSVLVGKQPGRTPD